MIMHENWTDLVGWFNRARMFRRVHQGPTLRPTGSYLQIQIRSLVTLSHLPSDERYLSAKWIVSRDTIRSLVGRKNHRPTTNLSLSLSLQDDKKIRWNYLISGPTTNEITAQSWGVEFQLQLWSQLRNTVVGSIDKSIDFWYVISNFLSIGGEEHWASAHAFRRHARGSTLRIESRVRIESRKGMSG